MPVLLLILMALGSEPAPDPSAPPTSRADVSRCVEPPPRNPLGLSVETDLVSRFLWRGEALSRGPVFQASADATLEGLTASVFANWTLTETDDGRSLSAVVPELSYAWRLGRFEITPGAAFYWSTAGLNGASDDTTAEGTLALSMPAGPFLIEEKNYLDVKAAPGAYLGLLDVSSEREILKWTLKLTGEVAVASALFNRLYFSTPVSALDFLRAEAVVRHDLFDVLFVAFNLEASALVSPTLRRSHDGFLYAGGFGLGVEL
jgi:hypothetical protein